MHALAPEPPRGVVAAEIQPELVRCAAWNAAAAGVPVHVVRSDLRRPPFRRGAFDLAVANPPFRAVGTGRLAPVVGRALARHETALRLRELIATLTSVVAEDGRIVLAHLAAREEELLREGRAAGWAVESVVRARPLADRPPATVLVVMARGGSGGAGPPEEEDVVLQQPGGAWRPPVARLLEDARSPWA